MLKKIHFWNQINIVLLLILTACSIWTEKKPITTDNKPLVQTTPQPSIIPRREASPSLPQPNQPQSIPNFSGYLEQGIARWYDVTENGAKTASGDIYDLYELTAAHATLPLLSRVRVTNLRTGQRVVVTINDRLSDRNALIKLSYAAASQLGLVTNKMTSPVEIRGLSPTQ